MTRLVKGAKETFGWVVVSSDRIVCIPPLAWERYGFQVGEQACFLRGSSKSGGFGLTNRNLLQGLSFLLLEDRILGWDSFSRLSEIHIPESIPVKHGDNLLTVYGSCYALGFIAKGPIFEKAIQHPELDIFEKEEA